MLKVRLAVTSLVLAILLPFASTLFAQAASVVPAAPIPSQILTAKKVFISNIGGIVYHYWSGRPDRIYNEFYAAMKSRGQYEIVAVPADSDLVLDVRVVDD